MSEQLASAIARLTPQARQGLFGRLRRGIEKEGLRVTAGGDISQTPHPRSLGSKLTHPYITTDYSESLLEYITPVFTRPKESLEFLADLHRFSYRNLGDELIWPASMPPRLHGNDSVPIADYGTSNSGTMKHIYRKGLDVRYGRIMQSIAGIHYNFSLPDDFWSLLQGLEGAEAEDARDFRSRRYFELIRNFRRHSWILLYLFGASPGIDESFLDGGNDDRLKRQADRSLVSAYATSLRMSDLGYQNKVQAQLKICFNSLDNFVGTLRHAIVTPWKDYEKLGVKQADGSWSQLSSNILQIENEYYSDIRPKRVTRQNETPSQALEGRGVEYIEVRCLDLNPFLPVGIDETQIRFLDTFLIWCLLTESPWIDDEECATLDNSKRRVVEAGRDPELTLSVHGEERRLRDLAANIMDELGEVAGLLDSGDKTGSAHRDALAALAPRFDDAQTTPSGRLLTSMLDNGSNFVDEVLALAKGQAEQFKSEPTERARGYLLDQLVETSLQQQGDIEKGDHQDFDTFMAEYFASAHGTQPA
ncbi:glutamate--cysteine ligase [Cobetia amphilecti]|uniref:glutamate--cysteine ligase n=1 Tax=Cobetia amphilecti TaxID=1055104 RepID=UPI003296EF4E